MLQVLLPPLGFITAPSGVYSGLPRHASKTIFVASPAGSDTTGSDAGGSAFFVPFIILNQIPSFMAVVRKWRIASTVKPTQKHVSPKYAPIHSPTT